MSNIITRDYNGQVFQFRADGYFNMTKAAQAFGKDVRKFFITQEASDYLAALDEIVPKTAQLVETEYSHWFRH